MGIGKDAVHVNLTTISPNAATELAKLHEDHGAHYIAGPVRIIE
jgi:3-hydroxyisobutyrate dehydrogenase-like beta-hydroxyacid dehydrogenase